MKCLVADGCIETMSDLKPKKTNDATRFRRASAPKSRVKGAEVSPILGEIRARMHDPSLLEMALTHASSTATSTQINYERLEFLGDAVLGLVVVELIYHKFPDASEGSLARLKATLVSAQTLSEVATDHSFFEAARLGDMPRSQLEMARKNVGADIVESIIGAVYLDQGLEAARSLIYELFGDRFDKATLGQTGARDAKTELHELVQGTLHDRPAYHVVQQEGLAHARQFLVEVRIRNVVCGSAWGSNHKSAEQGAATEALAAIQKGQLDLEKLEAPQQ